MHHSECDDNPLPIIRDLVFYFVYCSSLAYLSCCKSLGLFSSFFFSELRYLSFYYISSSFLLFGYSSDEKKNVLASSASDSCDANALFLSDEYQILISCLATSYSSVLYCRCKLSLPILYGVLHCTSRPDTGSSIHGQ